MIKNIFECILGAKRPIFVQKSDFWWKLAKSLIWIFALKTKLYETHYSKSHCPKIQFWQNPNIFTSFSPTIFLTIFFVKSKLPTAKKSKPQHFREFFTQKIDNFLCKVQISMIHILNSINGQIIESCPCLRASNKALNTSVKMIIFFRGSNQFMYRN